MTLTISPYARLNTLQRRFAEALAARVTAPIYVASGERTHGEQASILLGLIKRGNKLGVYSQRYRDEMLSAYHAAKARDVEGDEEGNDARAVQLMTEMSVRHGEPVGTHLAGQAIDLRIVDLTADQKANIRSAAEAMGANVLHEFNPEHFHVGDLHEAVLDAAAPGTEEGIGTGTVIALFGVGILGAILIAVGTKQRKAA